MRSEVLQQVRVLQIDGTTLAAQYDIDPRVQWEVRPGTADYNGDGDSDVVVQHKDTGTISMWLINGTRRQLAGVAVLALAQRMRVGTQRDR